MWIRSTVSFTRTAACSHALPIAFAIVLSLQGCIAFYKTEEVQLRVVDAATDAPIPGARVHVRHHSMFVINPPPSGDAATDSNGRATVRCVPNWVVVSWEVRAPGYLAPGRYGFREVSGRQVPTLVDSIHDGVWVIPLHREPAPTLTVIVPRGYTGPLALDRRPTPASATANPMQRIFETRMREGGVVDAGALMPTGLWLDYFTGMIVVDEGGIALPRADGRVGPSDRAVRFVTSAGDRALFAVGTLDEERAIESVVYRAIPGPPGSRSVSFDESGFDGFFLDRGTRTEDQAEYDATR